MRDRNHHTISFIEEKCTKCGLCEADCPQLAVHPEINKIDSNCIQCDHCVSICPVGALAVNGAVPQIIIHHNVSADNFLNLIKSKRSIRRYLQKGIEDEIIQKLVETFAFIPTAKNARESYLQIISGPMLDQLDDGVCQTLNRTFNRLFNKFTWPLWYLFTGRKAKSYFKTKQRFIERQSIQSKIITHDAPLVLLFHAPNSSMSNGTMDCNIAAAYLALYASTLGLGTCYNGYIVHALKSNKKLSQAMGFPQKNRVFSALLVGYPKYKYAHYVVR